MTHSDAVHDFVAKHVCYAKYGPGHILLIMHHGLEFFKSVVVAVGSCFFSHRRSANAFSK